MKDYIEQALRTESKPNEEVLRRLRDSARAMHALLGLDTEKGELADQFKRHIFYGTPLDLTNIDEEVGDFLWYLAILMDYAGIDFERCMEANIRKLRARYPERFDPVMAIHRNLAAEREQLTLQDDSCVSVGGMAVDLGQPISPVPNTCPGCGCAVQTMFVCPACAAKGVKWSV